jgi:hypothetical protein
MVVFFCEIFYALIGAKLVFFLNGKLFFFPISTGAEGKL